MTVPCKPLWHPLMHPISGVAGVCSVWVTVKERRLPPPIGTLHRVHKRRVPKVRLGSWSCETKSEINSGGYRIAIMESASISRHADDRYLRRAVMRRRRVHPKGP